MDASITTQHAEALLKHLQRDDLDAAGRFALQHPLLAASVRSASADQPCVAGQHMRDLALQAVHTIASDAVADSKPVRARMLLELFYFKRLSRHQVMDQLGYSLNGEGSYARLRQYAITCFARALEGVCASLVRLPRIPTDWSRSPASPTGRHAPGRTFHALMGRAGEMQQLECWANAPDQPAILCIHGMGGVGKTALAIELAHRLLSHSRPNAFDGVLWVSAKRQVVLGNHLHEIQLQPTQRLSLEAVIEVLLHQLGLNLDLGANDGDRCAALCEALSRQRHLIVLDNADELEDETAVVAGLIPLIGSSKLLITSRNRLGAPVAEHLTLAGLSRDDSIAYLKFEAITHNIAQLDEDDDQMFTAIHAATCGLPLALKLLIGQLRHEAQGVFMRGLNAAINERRDFLRYLFEQNWHKLSEEEKRLWMILGRASAAPVTREHLMCLAQPIVGTGSVVDALAAHGVVEVALADGDETIYSLHPLARAFVNELPSVVYMSDEMRVFHRRGCFVSAARGWLACAQHDGAETVIRSDDACANVTSVAAACAAAGLHDDVILLWNVFSEAQYNQSYWRDYIRLDYSCLEAARASGNVKVEITVLCELGWALCDVAEYAQAGNHLRRALAMATENGDVASSIKAERYLASLELRQNHLSTARAGFEQLLDKIPCLLGEVDDNTRTRLIKHQSTLHDSLANVLIALGEFDEAEWHLELCEQSLYRINATAGVRSLMTRAHLRRAQLRLEEAEHSLTTCLELARQLNARDAFADALMLLAHIALQRNDPARAADLAEQALELFFAIGAMKREQAAKRFLIALQDGSPVVQPQLN